MPEERKTLGQRMHEYFPVTRRDALITIGILGLATVVCTPLRLAGTTTGFAFPVFVLAVLLISRLTAGYFYGIVAAVLGVVCVNFAFTYPFLAFNFTIDGYPLTFLTLLMVSIFTSALTTKMKKWEAVRADAEKERMRSNLLRSISHDIRTPLTSIIGSASAILDNPDLPKEQQKEMLENVREEGQWLIRVVENLLSITRMGGETELVKGDEVAEEVLASAARAFRKRFPGIAITVRAPEELLMVPMDPILIIQVLNNLLENAVIHGETTTAVRLSVTREGDDARFSVADNGQGIPADVLPRLFDGTLKHSETSAVDGKRNMGLGLSVCRAIVKAHGGHLNARNLRQGAEFCFTLPLTKEESA